MSNKQEFLGNNIQYNEEDAPQRSLAQRTADELG